MAQKDKSKDPSLYLATPENEIPKEEKQIEVPQWTCKLESEPKAGAFTVGEFVNLSCSGEAPVDFSRGTIGLKWSEGADFALRIRELKDATSNEVSFESVSYQVGKWSLDKAVVTLEGKPVVRLGGLILPVKSVQDPQQPVQKPFGVAEPFYLTWPMWLLALGGILVSVILLSVLLYFRKQAQRKRVEHELQMHDTAAGAYNQLQRDLRVLTREFDFSFREPWSDDKRTDYLVSLDKFFRLFLLREFRVPALDWGKSALFREMKRKKKRSFKRYGKKLHQTFTEIERAKGSPSKVSPEGCQKLLYLCRETSTEIWRTHGGKRK